ncbi:MAG: LysR family transcriptional regulator, partial [Methylobacterium sp.]|nr:LysR family transcriptional regulator [Methylobacterium sp.]
IAVIDQFTVAHGSMQGIATIPIAEPTQFQTYVAIKNDKAPSVYAETFVTLLRQEMDAVVRPRAPEARSRLAG